MFKCVNLCCPAWQLVCNGIYRMATNECALFIYYYMYYYYYQGRGHCFEGGGYNFASGASEKFGPPPFAYLGDIKQSIARLS